MNAGSGDGLHETLTESTLRRMAGGRSFARGEAYFAEGAVLRLRTKDGAVTASVRGSREYKVRLRVLDGDLDWSCSCPVGGRGEFCKHGVAVGLAWIRDDHDLADEDAPTFGEREIRAFLIGLDKEELVSLLLERAEEDERLYRLLSTRAARSQGGEPDLAVWREAIDDAVETNGYVAYGEAYHYYKGIEDVVLSFEDLLEDGKAGAVIELAEHGLKALERSLGYVDDSDGWLGGLAERLQELHLSACREAKPDPRALAKRLFAWETEAGYDFFHGAVQAYAEVLGKQGLAAYRELAERAWAKVPALSPESDDPDRYGARYRITSIMETLARMSGDTDRLVEIKSRDLSMPYQFLKIAEIYNEAGNRDLALEWAERGWQAFSETRRDERLREFIAEAYHDRGRHEEALALIWDAFVERADSSRYWLLRQHAETAGQWPQWREKALAFIRERISAGQQQAPERQLWMRVLHRDRSVLVEIFLAEKDVESAWKEAKEGGCSEGLWLNLAQAREEAHPAESIAIYRSHVDRLLRHTGQNVYAESVDYLGRIRKLLMASDRSAAFEPLVAEIRNTHKRKRNLMKMLDRRKW